MAGSKCTQTLRTNSPYGGWEVKRHSKLRRQIKCEGLNGVARSRVVLRLASLATRTGEELARGLVHITGHGCASIKKNWLFLHSTFFVESRFDFRHSHGSGFWEHGFICRTVASNRAHVYHVLAAAGGVPPSFLWKLSRGEVVNNRLRLLSIVPRIYYLPLHSFNINL